MLVLAMLAFSGLAVATSYEWTEWKNRDGPAGSGDWETKIEMSDICENPIDIECKTVEGEIDYTQTGQAYTCTPSHGGSCDNSQNNYQCLDYKVRFKCPVTSPTTDIKANGADSPSSVQYETTFTISWTSNGEYCEPYGHFVPLQDGGLWTDLGNLPASGSETLVAKHNNLGYQSTLQVGIQCYIGVDSTKDLVHIPIHQVQVDEPVNQAPIITGVSGPTNLKVGEQGKWTISAYDPEGGILSYSVHWRDENLATESAPQDQTASFTHVYYSAGTFKPVFTVSDVQGEAAQSSISVNVKASQPGEESVEVTMAAEPQEITLGDSFKVYGTITYKSDANTDEAKRFKVVTSFSNYPEVRAVSAAPKAKAIRLAANDNILDSVVKSVAQAISPAKKATTAKEAGPAASTGSSGGGKGTVSAVAVVAGDISSQQRVDYISLGPGESATVSTYFTPRTKGTKLAKIKVYEYMGTVCPASTGAANSAEVSAVDRAPCRDNYKLVASASAKVDVSEQTPPPPPQEPATGTLVLYKGWNMVSVPVMEKISMERLADECGTSQYAWRLTEQGYVKERTLVPGFGYWVKSTQECKYQVEADDYTSSLSKLFSGWNLVGAPGNEEAISDYLGNCRITSGPWYYSHGPIVSSATNPYIYSAKLEPAKAYWIKVASACELGSIDEVPPAPPS